MVNNPFINKITDYGFLKVILGINMGTPAFAPLLFDPISIPLQK